MPATVWTGSLSFGLLTIPIRLYAAARSQRTRLHQIHAATRTRLRQPLYCPSCKRIVNRSEVVRGYETEKGKYVLIDNEDLKKITPQSSRVMEILAFVKESEVDPIYFESSYLAMPEKDNEKPYVLLVKALEERERVAIAKATMHQREYTVFIRPRDHGLTIHTMYYPDEIRSVPGYGKNSKDIDLRPQEIRLAEQLVDALAQSFDPKKYHNTYEERLRALIAAKEKGRTISEEPAARRAPVIDMMEALKRSVQASEGAQAGKKPARRRSASAGEHRHRAAS